MFVLAVFIYLLKCYAEQIFNLLKFQQCNIYKIKKTKIVHKLLFVYLSIVIYGYIYITTFYHFTFNHIF